MIRSLGPGFTKPNIRPALILVVITTILLTSYVCSFLALRRRVWFTVGVPSGETRTITSFYFSSDQRLNSMLYWFFYPIHRSSEPVESGIYLADLLSPLYVRDLGFYYRIGVGWPPNFGSDQ
jgi:hypothetical protein